MRHCRALLVKGRRKFSRVDNSGRSGSSSMSILFSFRIFAVELKVISVRRLLKLPLLGVACAYAAPEWIMSMSLALTLPVCKSKLR